MTKQKVGAKFMSRQEVAEDLGISSVTLWRLGRNDGSFPRMRRISPGRVGILRDEYDAWVSDRPAVN